MAVVRIIADTTVRPASPTELTRRMELTPCDLQTLQIDYIQKGLLYDTWPLKYTDIDHLKATLSRALDYFHPLAGRLATVHHNDGTTSFFIDCNAAGAQFIQAAADGIAAADILNAVYTPLIVNSFFPLNGVHSHEGTTKPLLAVQVTELAGGGVFIAASANHSASDGTTFWNFFNAWSELSRGSEPISLKPVLDRFFPVSSGGEAVYPIKIHFPKHPLPRLAPKETLHLRERVFRYRRQKIALLKARAATEASPAGARFSSLQVIVAHLWRAVVRAQQIGPDEETSCRLLVGLRHRLAPPLPANYFGNAVLMDAATATAGELLGGGGMGFATLKLNQMVGAQTSEKVERFSEEWVKEPRLVSPGDMEAKNSLTTISSPLFNVYGNDFGWGRPAAVRSGVGNKHAGMITVYPGAEDGSVDIEACLLPETLDAMARDTEFMDAVTV